jgi:uncharacterized protein (TIGR02246 family)
MSRTQTLTAVIGLVAVVIGPAVPRAGAHKRQPRSAAHDVTAAKHRYDEALKGPAGGVAALFTEDGELLEPGMEALHGRSAILNFLAPFAKLAAVDSVRTDVGEVEVFGDSAVLWGQYHQTVTPQGQPALTLTGRIVAEFRRQAGGAWLLRRVIVQPFPPR